MDGSSTVQIGENCFINKEHFDMIIKWYYSCICMHVLIMFEVRDKTFPEVPYIFFWFVLQTWSNDLEYE